MAGRKSTADKRSEIYFMKILIKAILSKLHGTYSLRPKISVVFASREITLTKYIIKILIFIIHN